MRTAFLGKSRHQPVTLHPNPCPLQGLLELSSLDRGSGGVRLSTPEGGRRRRDSRSRGVGAVTRVVSLSSLNTRVELDEDGRDDVSVHDLGTSSGGGPEPDREKSLGDKVEGEVIENGSESGRLDEVEKTEDDLEEGEAIGDGRQARSAQCWDGPYVGTCV